MLNPGALDPGMTMDDGSGTGRSIAKGVELGYASDGDSVDFSVAWSQLPEIVFLPGGITFSTSLGTDTSQYLIAEATSVSTTGFTARIVIRNPVGTPATHTDNDTDGPVYTGGSQDYERHKTQTAQAWDDRYKFQFDVAVKNGDPIYNPEFNINEYQAGQVVVGIYVAKTSGVWTKVGTKLVQGSSGTSLTTVRDNQTRTVTVDGLGKHVGREFGISIESDLYGSSTLAFDSVYYETATAPTEESATGSGITSVPYLIIGA